MELSPRVEGLMRPLREHGTRLSATLYNRLAEAAACLTDKQASRLIGAVACQFIIDEEKEDAEADEGHPDPARAGHFVA